MKKPLYIKLIIYVCSYILLFIISFFDYWAGSQISFSLFYLIPVMIITWKFKGKHGLFISIISAILWLLADKMSGHQYSHKIILLWNAFIRFGFYITITVLLTKIINLLEEEKVKASIDPLTEISNSRAFYDLAEKELTRSRRYNHPFTVAYIDLDNFKNINDTLGHLEGNRLLIEITDEIKNNIRSTDIFSRLGGDEFALMLTETGERNSLLVLKKIKKNVIKRMKQNNWPVTISIGAVFYKTFPADVSEMLKNADQLMYKAKKNGKNTIKAIAYVK